MGAGGSNEGIQPCTASTLIYEPSDQPYNTLWSICFLENFVLVFGVDVFCFVLKQGLKKA